jgi:hypothetical protein
MPLRKPKPAASPKEREVARKPRKPRARKSADRPSMGRQPRQRNRCAVRPPASQGEPVTPLVMWRVYKHPKDFPGEYVARKFVMTEDFYGPSNESISSRSLRDVRSVLRSLYRGLVQLKRLPDDEPHIVEVWL